jgi:hypothetical protein
VLVLGVIVGQTAHLPQASAQTVSAKAAAESQALFEEAMTLIKSGQYAEACPKLEASLALEPGVGTRYYLADCYQRIGRTASAYAMFRNAEEVAKDKAQREEARQRAKTLEARLVRVMIDVPEDVRKLPGLLVQRGGEALLTGQFGTAVPVDPGNIPISATAAGKKRWTMMLSAVKEGATLTVQVPTLEELPRKGAAPSPAEGAGAKTWPPMRIAGAGAFAAGVVSAGVGLGLGLVAVEKKNASEKQARCSPDGQCPDAAGVALRADGRAAGDSSTALFVVGGVLLAAGTVLYLTAPRAEAKKSDKPAVSFHVGPASLGLSGRW